MVKILVNNNKTLKNNNRNNNKKKIRKKIRTKRKTKRNDFVNKNFIISLFLKVLHIFYYYENKYLIYMV